MFHLKKEEKDELVTNCDRLQQLKHSSALPRAFTEQGVAMLSSVLNNERAIEVNIQIMRTFTQLRKMLSTHEDLKRKIESMEKKYDQQFQIVFEAIKQLLSEENKPKKKIGFTVKEKQKAYGKQARMN
ncbi:MAG: ORF6N domain-containing protein [Pseudomonadota bacterium]